MTTSFYKSLRKMFSRKHPYAPVGYIGRKQVQEILGAKIKKKRKLFSQQATQ